ncbi:MAG: hypothetical protein MMC33_001119 [Icmadophila ericetorum]|nr:hypothetical protein [Icmadophila ericetorum]
MPVLDSSVGAALHAQLDQKEFKKGLVANKPQGIKKDLVVDKPKRRGRPKTNNEKSSTKAKEPVSKNTEQNVAELIRAIPYIEKEKAKRLVRKILIEGGGVESKKLEDVLEAAQVADLKDMKKELVRKILIEGGALGIEKENAPGVIRKILIKGGGLLSKKLEDALEAVQAAGLKGTRENSSKTIKQKVQNELKNPGLKVATEERQQTRKKTRGVKSQPVVVRKRSGSSSNKSAVEGSVNAPSKGIKLSQLKGNQSLDVLKEKKSTVETKIEEVNASELKITPVELQQPPVPSLSYGLDRVLFNPGVYHLQDPRSKVYNFDPYLQTIMPVSEFDFNALKRYITSSKDRSLESLAREHGKKYVGSSSSMTGVLSHFHFLLSQWRSVNTDMLSQGFPGAPKTFTLLQRSPSAVFLKWQNGTYAIDADKEFDTSNILSMLGKSMEKLLTLSTEDYERYRKSNPDEVTEEERTSPESFHYSTMGDFLMRSQLDAYDARLPGSGMFDLKTRAVVTVRMDVQKWQETSGYQIKSLRGEWESFEREYFDLIRAAFLKYSLQVRVGRMDGIFVAFHNTERIFGFQYISLPEMDLAIHGQSETVLGSQEFMLSLDLLNKVLEKATKKFPEQSLRLHFETRESRSTFMYIFAEPVTEEQIQEVQTRNATKIEEFEREVLGLAPLDDGAVEKDSKWEEIHADVQETIDKDKRSLEEAELDLQGEQEGHHREEFTETEQAFQGTSSADSDSVEDDADGDDLEDTKEVDSELEDNKEGQDLESIGNDAEGDDEEQNDGEEKEREEENDLEEAVDEREIEERCEDLETSESSGEEINERETLQTENGEETVIFVSLAGKDEPQTPPVTNDEAHEDGSAESTATDESSMSQGHEEASVHDAAAESTPLQIPEEERYVPDNVGVSESDDADGDIGFLNEIDVENAAIKEAANPEIFGMTLTIRNKVNNSYVTRPRDLGTNDKWTVEYSLGEISKKDSIWSLYQACQARRKLRLEKKEEEEGEDQAVSYYIRRMRELSKMGKEWREQEDAREKRMPKVILAQSSARAKPNLQSSSLAESKGTES